MEYLEERYPEPALLAADPADRALARLRIFRQDEMTGRRTTRLRRGEDGRARAARRSARAARHAAGRRRRGSAAASTGSPTSRFVPWILRSRDMLGVGLDPYPALAGLARAARASGPPVAAESALVAAL